MTFQVVVFMLYDAGEVAFYNLVMFDKILIKPVQMYFLDAAHRFVYSREAEASLFR